MTKQDLELIYNAFQAAHYSPSYRGAACDGWTFEACRQPLCSQRYNLYHKLRREVYGVREAAELDLDLR